jgi:Ubiquitin-conjugating enzyme
MNHLGSSLISIFSELDAVEGVDVELENNFDKFSVKRDVAELLLRLWSHPSGVARASIVCLEAEKISVFVSSVAAAIGLLLDDACLKLADVRDLLLEGTTSRAFGLNFEFLSRAIACMLFSSRRMLLLLCHISEDKRIASICGGVNTKGTTATSNTAPVDLASMFSNFMDRLTAEDGGTNPGLDLRRSTMPTSELCLKSSKMSDSARHAATKDLLWARRFVLDEYGLDISVMAHQFLALAARWHTAADSGTSRYSQFLRRLATHGECSAAHLQAVFTRLVIPCDQLNEEAILESDGHVDFDVWKGKYDIQPSRKKGSRKPDYQYFTAQDQVTHDRLVSVVSHDAISTFIDDLKNVTVKSAVASRNKDDSIDGETITLLENSLLADSPPCADDKEYSECLCEWVVSSDSFLSRAGTGRFAHSYDATARKRSNDNIGSGKVLVKEAKQCEKHLPAPNVNSSIFVCFAEERMDLCRAIIIGAADTPYSLGMFEFDVFFPVMYPFAAPLVTFKTTGKNTSPSSSSSIYWQNNSRSPRC